jgi:ParB family chromosome partitioning protein
MNEIKKIKIKDIDSFNNHPFLVNEDDSFLELKKSIQDNGLLNPVIVRPKANRYEMISGHRRIKALEQLGYTEVDSIVKELTDDEAIIYMVDSNLQREKILPSEKAFAYKMKLDAMKHQGKKIETSTPEEQKSKTSIQNIANESKDSREQIRRYIRLTYLIPELLQLVDDTVKYENKQFLTMGIKPAVEISYLSKEEQKLLYAEITYDDLTPSHAQAIKIRKLSNQKKLTGDTLEEILTENKGNQNEQIAFNKEKIEEVLPYDLIKRDKRYIEEYIIKALKNYSKTISIERGDDNDINI